jgi:defect-in-organelle-trafficking protein DotD
MLSWRTIVLELAVGGLTGCTAPGAANDFRQELDHNMQSISRGIQFSQADLYNASVINQAAAKQPALILNNQQLVSITWQGDALQLCDQLARSRGLRFSSVGVRLPLPVVIEVDNLPYESVLNLLRAQIGYRADLMQEGDELLLNYNRPNS